LAEELQRYRSGHGEYRLLFLSNTPQLCCGDEHITDKQLLCSRILGQYHAV
jgi:hypothetical protein